MRKNVVVEVPTADFLVNQMRAGSLDAIVVYEVNVAPHPEHFDLIPSPEEFSKAVQPFRGARGFPERTARRAFVRASAVPFHRLRGRRFPLAR